VPDGAAVAAHEAPAAAARDDAAPDDDDLPVGLDPAVARIIARARRKARGAPP
jgi:hypothetical protein